MRGRSRFSCRQWLILAIMAVILAGVLLALLALVRKGVPESPLPAAVVRVTRTIITARSSPTPTSPGVTPAGPTPTAFESLSSPEVVAARRIDALGDEAGRIRELPKQQEVPLAFLTEQEMVSEVRNVHTNAEQQVQAQRQQALLAALDLLPDPGEVYAVNARVRAGHLIAFYDPVQDQIFLGAAARSSDTADLSLVHQYAHALVDQHFNLLALTRDPPNADAARARDALLEGDATAVLALHSSGGLDQADLDMWAKHLIQAELTDYEGYPSSRAMEEVLLFPYRDGARFVGALLAAGWWPAVNRAYMDPPESTEQILHPEKYLSAPRDTPRTLQLFDLSEELGDGWQLVGEEVVGELVLRAHLDQYLPDSSTAQEAAAGWDGDRAALWQGPDGQEVLVMRVVWDDRDEAAEFVEGYATLIQRRLRATSRVVRPITPAGGRWWRGETGDAFIQRERDAVLVIWAPNTDVMEQVLSVYVFAE